MALQMALSKDYILITSFWMYVVVDIDVSSLTSACISYREAQLLFKLPARSDMQLEHAFAHAHVQRCMQTRTRISMCAFTHEPAFVLVMLVAWACSLRAASQLTRMTRVHVHIVNVKLCVYNIMCAYLRLLVNSVSHACVSDVIDCTYFVIAC